MYVDPALIEYAIRLVTATRKPKDFGLKELQHYILFGASPRASINLILTARALAFVRGRSYALPQDVLDMALDVMRHRAGAFLRGAVRQCDQRRSAEEDLRPHPDPGGAAA